jgi:hypothetical protein
MYIFLPIKPLNDFSRTQLGAVASLSKLYGNLARDHLLYHASVNAALVEAIEVGWTD